MVIALLPPELVANRFAVAVSSAIPVWPPRIKEFAVTTAPLVLVITPWLKRPSLLMLAGATDEETFKVVPLYRFKRSAITESSSALDSSMVLAAASVLLPTSNAIPVVPARETIPVPAEIVFCSMNLLAVSSIEPPIVDIEFATVRLSP